MKLKIEGLPMRLIKWCLISLVTLLICTSAISAQAQDDRPPIDDDFMDALVMMAVNHDMMEGRNELSNLNALKDYVKEYYMWRSMDGLDHDTRVKLELQEIKHVNMIEGRIDKVRTALLAEIEGYMSLFTDENKLSILNKHFGMPGIDSPPEAYLDRMSSHLATDINDQVIVVLDGNTISIMPSIAPAINDSTGWNYNVPAISDSSAGESSDSLNGNDSQPQADPSESTRIIEKRPVRFTNNGFESVTVVVETYTPAPGLSPDIPIGSTVVSPETNSSSSLELPLGTYTFCYYWQLDEDYNNDDYFDYHHRVTTSYTLNENSSKDVQSAVAVTLSPESNVSNPNGKCGETAQGNSDLTPEEQANVGTHQYSIVYHAPGVEWLHGETAEVLVSIVFSNGTLQMGGVGEEQYSLVPAGINTYTWLDDNGNIQTYIFTMEGFEIQSKVGLEGDYADALTICTRQD